MENEGKDGIKGITTPGGSPWNINLVPLSGLNSIMDGGNLSLMAPSSSAIDDSSHLSSIMS